MLTAVAEMYTALPIRQQIGPLLRRYLAWCPLRLKLALLELLDDHMLGDITNQICQLHVHQSGGLQQWSILACFPFQDCHAFPIWAKADGKERWGQLDRCWSETILPSKRLCWACCWLQTVIGI